MFLYLFCTFQIVQLNTTSLQKNREEEKQESSVKNGSNTNQNQWTVEEK